MKRNVFILFLSLGLLAVTLPSCGDSDTKGSKEHYCPMKCEGEKTYQHINSCPVCGMNLKEKK